MAKYRAKPDFIQRSEPLVPLALKVSAAERGHIQTLAALDKVSVSAFVRRVLKEYLAKVAA